MFKLGGSVLFLCSPMGDQRGLPRVTAHRGLEGQPHNANYFLFFIFVYLFIYLAAPGLSCGTRDLHCHVRDLLVVAGGLP